MVKICCWGNCNTDSRYPERLEGGVVFKPFPKPGRELEKCRRWIELCGRPLSKLNEDMLRNLNRSKHKYVCSKHFVNGMGPTQDNPDPLPFVPSSEPMAQRPGDIISNEKKAVNPAKKPRKQRLHRTAGCQTPGDGHDLHGEPMDTTSSTTTKQVLLATKQQLHRKSSSGSVPIMPIMMVQNMFCGSRDQANVHATDGANVLPYDDKACVPAINGTNILPYDDTGLNSSHSIPDCANVPYQNDMNYQYPKRIKSEPPSDLGVHDTFSSINVVNDSETKGAHFASNVDISTSNSTTNFVPLDPNCSHLESVIKSEPMSPLSVHDASVGTSTDSDMAHMYVSTNSDIARSYLSSGCNSTTSSNTASIPLQEDVNYSSGPTPAVGIQDASVSIDDVVNNGPDHSYFSSGHTISKNTNVESQDSRYEAYMESLETAKRKKCVGVKSQRTSWPSALVNAEALIRSMKKTIRENKHQMKEMNTMLEYSRPRSFGPGMLTDDQSTMWWTGIPKKEMFQRLFDRLKPKVETHKMFITITEGPHVVSASIPLIYEYFGVLVRLKLGMPSAVLAQHLGITEHEFLIIFQKWLSLLREELELLTACQQCPSQQQVEMVVSADGQSVNVEVNEEPTQLLVNHTDGRIKYFQILDEVMPWSNDIIRDVVTVCNCLSNFHIPVGNDSLLSSL